LEAKICNLDDFASTQTASHMFESTDSMMQFLDYPSLKFQLSDLAESLAKLQAEFKAATIAQGVAQSTTLPVHEDERIRTFRQLRQARKRKRDAEEMEPYGADTTRSRASTKRSTRRKLSGRPID